ncbi:ABC transporter ATP-binding protein [Candidatus Fermentibacterales bacterium]|nr:ABC transporter ATP-binding protein [Candidatus Fermentibacterales bacterium]
MSGPAGSGIEVRSVSRSFWSGREEIRALADVSLTAHKGEVVGLLGPNGAGKTTLLRILATLLRPDSGSARVNGYDVIEDAMEVRRSIGYLSTRTGVYGRLTPLEIMDYFGSLHRMSPSMIAERTEMLFGRFDLWKLASLRCEELSGGNQQRVSLARALLHDPPVLILDEPTTGLDVIAAATTIGFIDISRDLGCCVLFSTHVLSEAEKLCDRIAILHEGEIRADGTLEELRERTGQRFLEDIFLHLAAGSVLQPGASGQGPGCA